MIAVAAPVGLVCVGWLALTSRWVDMRSLRRVCVFMLLVELLLTAVSLASASTTGCSSVFYAMASWGSGVGRSSPLVLCSDELSCHFSGILLTALILCFVFLSEYFEFDVNGVSIALLSSLFSQLAFVFFATYDILSMLFFWEWISITSFFLILFWSMRVQTIKAALKVFVISQIGDLFFIVALVSMHVSLGASDLPSLAASVGAWACTTATIGPLSFGLPVLWCVGTLCALWLKAAQVIFFPWLIDAMEAPVPISAQLHSSTLVIIGFYVAYRLRFVLGASEVWCSSAVFVGVATACCASLLGFFQDDAKRLLACSTAAQLGYVTTLVGLQVWSASLLLLTFCCCNKAYTFVWLGVVMERRSGLSDVRGLRNVRLLWAERVGLLTAIANSTIWPGAFVWHVKGLLVRADAVASQGALVWGLLAMTWVLGGLYLGRLFVELIRCPAVLTGAGTDVAASLMSRTRNASPSSSAVTLTQLVVLTALLCYGPLASLILVPVVLT